MARYEVQVLNLDEVLGDLEEIDTNTLHQLLAEAGQLVRDEAYMNAPKKSGELANSLQYEVEGETCAVGTNKKYAPYVEYGTGKFARDGGGRPGWWVFVKGDNGGYEHADKTRKIYTLEEAKQIKAILIAKGLNPEDVWITQGQHPQPFLEPALDAKAEDIRHMFINAIIKGKEKK